MSNLIEPSDYTLAGLDDCTRDYIAGLEKRLDAVIAQAEFIVKDGYHAAYLAGFNSAMQETLRIAKGETL